MHPLTTCGNGVVVEEPNELWPPQLDAATSVPIGVTTEGTGNRVSVNGRQRVRGRGTGVESERGIARHAARRDGRCEQVETQVNARRSTSGGPVHSSCPGRCEGESRSADRGAFVFPDKAEIVRIRDAHRHDRGQFSMNQRSRRVSGRQQRGGRRARDPRERVPRKVRGRTQCRRRRRRRALRRGEQRRRTCRWRRVRSTSRRACR